MDICQGLRGRGVNGSEDTTRAHLHMAVIVEMARWVERVRHGSE